MSRIVQLILAPFHAGERNVRVGAGPGRLMDDGLEAELRSAGLRTSVTIISDVDQFEGEIGRSFEVKRRVAGAVAEAKSRGAFPLVLAGNCNTTVGVAAGVRDPKVGVVWFDAHADFDTPDEHESGYFDGMGAATLTGQCWVRLAASIPGFRPLGLDRLVFCGIRDLSERQRQKVLDSGIKAVFGRTDGSTDYRGGLAAQLRVLPFEKRMIHLDVDCLDTTVGTANEYASPGGLEVDELLDCLDGACPAASPVSLTIASFNPHFDGAAKISEAAICAAVRVAIAAASA